MFRRSHRLVYRQRPWNMRNGTKTRSRQRTSMGAVARKYRRYSAGTSPSKRSRAAIHADSRINGACTATAMGRRNRMSTAMGRGATSAWSVGKGRLGDVLLQREAAVVAGRDEG